MKEIRLLGGHIVRILEEGDLTVTPDIPKVAPKVEKGLHVCPDCESRLVYPTYWEEISDDSWLVTLRCPNCEWSTEDDFDQDLLDAFDEELDCGFKELASDYDRLSRTNMADWVDRFTVALKADAIDPLDF